MTSFRHRHLQARRKRKVERRTKIDRRKFVLKAEVIEITIESWSVDERCLSIVHIYNDRFDRFELILLDHVAGF